MGYLLMATTSNEQSGLSDHRILRQNMSEKGLDLLVDAFIELKKSDKHEELRLAIAGTLPV